MFDIKRNYPGMPIRSRRRPTSPSPSVQNPDQLFGARLITWFDIATLASWTLSNGRVTQLYDRRGAGHPTSLTSENPYSSTQGCGGSHGWNGTIGYPGWRSISDPGVSAASDWLIGLALNATAHYDQWVYDIAAGRLLVGANQFYTDEAGFRSGTGALGSQILIMEARGTTSLKRYVAGDGGTPATIATGTYNSKVAGQSSCAWGATYIGSGGRDDCYYSELVVVQNPVAGDAENLVAWMRSHWNLPA